VLYNGVVEFQGPDGQYTTASQNSPFTVTQDSVKNSIIFKHSDQASITVKCEPNNTVTITAKSKDAKIRFRADSTAESAIPAIIQKQKNKDGNVLFTTNGRAELNTNSLFDKK
jgi:hypothetical protein